MKPLIGITSGEIADLHQPWSPTTYGQSRTYSDAVIAAGGIPVLLPIMEDESALRGAFERLDGILFAGGNDINPALYHEQRSPYTKDISDKRDFSESHLMRWAVAEDLPLFAICRGFQLFNVACGGSLYQDLLKEFPGATDHELSTLKQDRAHIAHNLKLAEGSLLRRIVKVSALAANTHHHQGVKELGVRLHASAWSEDGLIEAVEHENLFFGLGVQCHPEALFQTDEKWADVFNAFIAASAAKQRHALAIHGQTSLGV